jgi:NAD(P)-dependent dehydrogenase (short-subunit alcohol dehydrogenase family)
MSSAGTVCLITGATGQIGTEIALGMAVAGATLVLPYRNQAKAAALEAAIKKKSPDTQVHLDFLDLSSLAAVKAYTRLVSERHPGLSLLINNAATVPSSRQTTGDGIEVQFHTNVLVYVAMMEGLAAVLKSNAGSRVVNVASNYAGDYAFDDMQFTRRQYDKNAAYRQTKQVVRCMLEGPPSFTLSLAFFALPNVATTIV